MSSRFFTSIELPEQTAPVNPAASKHRIYIKTDGKLYRRNSSGVEVEVVAGNDSRLSNARTPTAHNHAASDINSGVLATARLGTGTANSSSWLRGDGVWATISAGVTTLAALTDVTVTSPATGQVLRWNGTVWANAVLAATDISGLFDATNPAALGTAAPGSATVAARRDHVHAMPTAANVGAPPTSRAISTSTGLTGGGNLTADRTLSIAYDATVPSALGTAAVGSAAAPARRDHVHPMPDITSLGGADQVLQGFPVTVATTGNITLSGHQTISTVTTTENMVVLVKNQTTASQNGVYLAKSGAWVRWPLLATAAQLAGAIVRNQWDGSIWKCAFNSTNVVGTDAIMWWTIVDRLSLDLAYAITAVNSDVPGYFPIGVSFVAASTTDGWPIDGMVETHRHFDTGTASQEIRDKEGKIALRRTASVSNTWHPWLAITPQSSKKATGAMTVNVGKDLSVTFDYPYAVAPMVTLTQMDLVNPESTFVSANSVGTSGFTLRAKRTAGTASFDVAWLATPMTQAAA